MSGAIAGAIRKINFLLRTRPFKGGWRIERFLSRIMPRPDGKIGLNLPLGFKIIIDPVNNGGLEEALYYRGIYEAGTINVLETCLTKNDIFVDVGSNIGLMSLFAAKRLSDGGKVYAFEPMPDVYAALEENIRINGLKNIEAFNFALGERNTDLSLYREKGTNRGQASLIKPKTENEIAEHRVKVQRLDDFILEKGIGNIKILKIDVEGWEFAVLKGAGKLLSSSSAPILCFEFSRDENDEESLLALYEYVLSINEYRIYKLGKGKEAVSGLVPVKGKSELPRHDNLFCFLPKHEKIVKLLKKER